jgi:hypothetical protein
MIAVGMVQMTVNQIVHVIAVRHSFMATTRAVDMYRVVRAARMALGALIGIRRSDFDYVIVVMIAVRMQQMTIAQVIGMPVVIYRGVSAIGSVVVFMIVVSIAFVHDSVLTTSNLLCNPAHP